MRYLLWSVFLAILLTAVAIFSRPLLPVDETRYVAVAWESHLRNDYLVSHLNGQPYSHKPPMLFWLINAVWTLTGVGSTSARLAAPAAGLACLVLTSLVTRRLWPDAPTLNRCAPIVLVTLMLWIVFCPLTMFDTLLTSFTLTALRGVLLAADGHHTAGWLLAGLSMGLGILSKGPVILVHVLPAAALAPWWSPSVRTALVRWYSGCFAAILVAASIGLLWAVPSARAGGEPYGTELLFGQTAGRMVSSFAHRHSFWWYLPWLPLCLMPWISFGAVWRGCRNVPLDRGLKFLCCWSGGSLLILSLVSGKQIYYLLPMLPACAIILTRLAFCGEQGAGRQDLAFIVAGTTAMGLLPLIANHLRLPFTESLSGLVPDLWCVPLACCGLLLLIPGWRTIERMIVSVGTAAVLFISLVVWAVSGTVWEGFNVEPVATFVAQSGRPAAWWGEYHGQFNFAGRLPIVQEIHDAAALQGWLKANPNGLLTIRFSTSSRKWKSLTESLRAIDRAAPAPDQQQVIRRLLQEHPDFPAGGLEPIVHYVQWIRAGLTIHPTIVVSFQ